MRPSGPPPGRHRAGGTDDTRPASVTSALARMLSADTDPIRNLGTFGTTHAEPEVHALLAEYLARNLINEAEYPAIHIMARACRDWVAGLWHAPEDVSGQSVSGSSEAAILAGVAMQRRWQATTSDNAPSGPNLVLGQGAHTCWQRFCRLFGVEARIVPMSRRHLAMDPEHAAAVCDSGTIGVVAVLGATDHGRYDDVHAVARALDQLQASTGLDVRIHVDAASGGFVAPFVNPDLAWDFRLPRVASINASSHKFGLTFPALGWILLRPAAAPPPDLTLHSPYIGGGVSGFAMSFSRAATPMVHQYYNIQRHGHDGYHAIHQAALGRARHIAAELAGAGMELLSDTAELPVVTFVMPGDPTHHNTIARRLGARGWHLPTYRLALPTEKVAVGRIVIRHGFTDNDTTQLLQDLTDALPPR